MAGFGELAKSDKWFEIKDLKKKTLKEAARGALNNERQECDENKL